MKNLQKLLIIAIFASIMPSAVVLCSEEPTKTAEMRFLRNISYLGGITFAAGATTAKALTDVKKSLLDAYDHKAYSLKEEAIMKQLTNNIKRNKALMGVSCLAILAPVIIPTAVDKINAINTQNAEINKELNKETI